MKVESISKRITEEILVFVAEDGKEFYTKEACEEYEKELKRKQAEKKGFPSEESVCLCTGNYMNYYDSEDGIDLFIIINEGNNDGSDPMDNEKFMKADKLCMEYCKGLKMNDLECKRLEKLLGSIFEYGVQVFRRR